MIIIIWPSTKSVLLFPLCINPEIVSWSKGENIKPAFVGSLTFRSVSLSFEPSLCWNFCMCLASVHTSACCLHNKLVSMMPDNDRNKDWRFIKKKEKEMQGVSWAWTPHCCHWGRNPELIMCVCCLGLQIKIYSCEMLPNSFIVKVTLAVQDFSQASLSCSRKKYKSKN